MREVDYANSGKPKINKGFTISLKEIEPWKTSNKTEFISFYNNSVFRREPIAKKKDYPILL